MPSFIDFFLQTPACISPVSAQYLSTIAAFIPGTLEWVSNSNSEDGYDVIIVVLNLIVTLMVVCQLICSVQTDRNSSTLPMDFDHGTCYTVNATV
jgi:hypothetical protein